MRRIASASGGATVSTSSFGIRSPSGIGTVFVHTISTTSGWSEIRLSAPAENSPCVHATRTERTSSSRSRSSNSNTVLPLAISSSRTMRSRPATSPMTVLMLTRSSAKRCLAPAATRTPSIRANAAASLALPRSGDTTVVFDRSWRRKCLASSRSACR